MILKKSKFLFNCFQLINKRHQLTINCCGQLIYATTKENNQLKTHVFCCVFHLAQQPYVVFRFQTETLYKQVCFELIKKTSDCFKWLKTIVFFVVFCVFQVCVFNCLKEKNQFETKHKWCSIDNNTTKNNCVSSDLKTIENKWFPIDLKPKTIEFSTD